MPVPLLLSILFINAFANKRSYSDTVNVGNKYVYEGKYLNFYKDNK